MLRTATRLARRPQNAPLVARSRPSSSAAAHADHDDHHHHEQDDTVYPKEGFTAPVWTRTIVYTVAAVLFYEYFGAPADNDQFWLPVAALQSDIASTRAAKETVHLQDRQLVRSATRPPIYRSRNPEDFYHVSPYGNPVGMTVEWNKPSKLRSLRSIDETHK
ncbi:hypothetical protein B0H13DRAFT_1975241, partial [Mycena leptocephala]